MSLTPTALDISPAGDWDFAGLFSPISFTATPPSQPSSVTSSSSRSSLAILPAELYRNILRHCSPRDLSRLCLVSRRVGSEARFMLYLDVDLHRSSESRVENWANTVAGSTHLSKILRSLCLSSTFVHPNYSQRYSQHDRTLLALKSALKGAINMTEFIAREFTRISPPKLSEIQSLCHNTIDLSIFDDCRHRFRRFDVYGKIFFTGRKNVDFYLQMSNIVEWTADDTITRTFIPPTLFPNLSTVNLRLAVLSDMRLLKFVMSRRIRRLRMDFAEFFTRADIIERTQAIKVGVAHQTLTHLQIETDGSSSAPDENLLWRPIDIAEDFAVQFPGLKFLSLMASHRNSSRHGCSRSRILGLLSTFNQLETFMCNVLECEVKGCKTCSSWTGLNNPQGRLKIVEDFMAICPSLSHVAFQTKHRSSSWMSFRKNRENMVKLTGLDILGDSSWREKP